MHNKAGMGIRKHRISGKSQLSPSLRHKMKLGAEETNKKRKNSNCKYNSVSEALRSRK